MSTQCDTEVREADGFPTRYCITHGQDTAQCDRNATLAETSGPVLLRAYAALTRRMHAATDLNVSADLRAQRDLIEAEILRRMNGAS